MFWLQKSLMVQFSSCGQKFSFAGWEMAKFLTWGRTARKGGESQNESHSMLTNLFFIIVI